MPIRLADSALQSLKKGLTILQKFRLLTFFRKTRTRQTQPSMKRIIGSLFAVAASVALVSSASALTWIEVGDAGQSIATSQTPIPAGQPLNSIFGSFLSTSDVDIFTIFISNPALFSATTVLGTGQSIATSQTPIPAGQPLNSIFGSFLSTSDVDIFTIFISNPALF